MATTITQEQVLTEIARLMGKRTLPTSGDNSDWEAYAQYALDYAWRYFQWDWTLSTATVTMASSPYMPTDMDLSGWRRPISSPNLKVTELHLLDYLSKTPSTSDVALEWESTKYKVRYSGETVSFIYQVTPPTLASDGAVYFPSAMTIAIGAIVYAKQAANPTGADISQEWDNFHAELDRHVSRSYRAVPRSTNLNLQDEAGVYTGYVGE